MSRSSFSKPIRFLSIMAVFILLIIIIAILCYQDLAVAFLARPFFNALILFVLLVGIIICFRQIFQLIKEVDWISQQQTTQERTSSQPSIVTTIQHFFGDASIKSLSATNLNSILERIQMRLDEQRDISRYLAGLLIFLGLLGTFWGLLITIHSVADIIQNMSGGGDAVAMFDSLKTQLSKPLNGMATSFSSSLFGLAGALIIGFLDLMTGLAQTRFYKELEFWLSQQQNNKIELEGVPAYVQALLEQTAEGLDRMQRILGKQERDGRQADFQLEQLSHQISRLSELISRESSGLLAFSETQNELRDLLRTMATQPYQQQQFSEDLRNELRLLARTIAASSRNPN